MKNKIIKVKKINLGNNPIKPYDLQKIKKNFHQIFYQNYQRLQNQILVIK